MRGQDGKQTSEESREDIEWNEREKSGIIAHTKNWVLEKSDGVSGCCSKSNEEVGAVKSKRREIQ